MSKIDDGGPAFPTTRSDGDGSNAWTQDGLSRRDYFAAKAMERYEMGDGSDYNELAARCYQIADAMIKASK